MSEVRLSPSTVSQHLKEFNFAGK
ncbi:hypothetical protein [Chitinophaga sp. 22620]